jgi:hypothetical protein
MQREPAFEILREAETRCLVSPALAVPLSFAPTIEGRQSSASGLISGGSSQRIAESSVKASKNQTGTMDMTSSNHSLSGLITICAGCKKTRDGSGLWQQSEDFRDPSKARFTHALCPDCMVRYGWVATKTSDPSSGTPGVSS